MSRTGRKNSIRIISGSYRGRRIVVDDHELLRPSTDRVRETVFNWLMHELQGSRCLDLFAGTGAFGLECLSRGAAHVQFVESNRQIAARIEQTLEALEPGGLPHRPEVRLDQQDAPGFLARQPSQPYNLVFLDPPYGDSVLQLAIDRLRQNNWLDQGALLYLETGREQTLPHMPAAWEQIKQAKTGASRYMLYRC